MKISERQKLVLEQRVRDCEAVIKDMASDPLRRECYRCHVKNLRLLLTRAQVVQSATPAEEFSMAEAVDAFLHPEVLAGMSAETRAALGVPDTIGRLPVE